MSRFSNINMLLAFVTVAKQGSVSLAAEVLNLTQPAVSHQIKRLTEEAGVKLFRRTATGVELTNDGESLVAKAERVLDAMTEFQQSAQKRAGITVGTLKIGTIVDPEFIRLGRLLNNLRAAFPEIETELVQGVSGEILNGVKSGQLDAGFYLSGQDDIEVVDTKAEAQIYSVTLADFSYRVIAPVGWQKRIENANWKVIAALPWIGTPEVSAHNRLLADIFRKHDCVQNVVALVDQEASMLEMVRAGIGLSLARESIALHQQQSFGLAVCNSVSVPARLSIVALERNKERPTIAALFGLLSSTWPAD